MNPYQFIFGQENITILHWNKETFRDESLKRQQLVEVNQAGISGALTASEARCCYEAKALRALGEWPSSGARRLEAMKQRPKVMLFYGSCYQLENGHLAKTNCM